RKGTGDHPAQILADFRGTLVADGGSSFNRAASKEGVVRAGCWAQHPARFTPATLAAALKLEPPSTTIVPAKPWRICAGWSRFLLIAKPPGRRPKASLSDVAIGEATGPSNLRPECLRVPDPGRLSLTRPIVQAERQEPSDYDQRAYRCWVRSNPHHRPIERRECRGPRRPTVDTAGAIA
ncbi:MAG: transposase, partial [Proteobacteria bacterium]|nr:transposase [Pseudomonadota bacterium]